MSNDTLLARLDGRHDAGEIHSIALSGCRPEPLAHYLKALGVLRLVAEQKDPQVRGCWRNDAFYIESNLDQDELVRFFEDEYYPTPIVAPWNGGSGFFESDNKAISTIESSTNARFCEYRRVILKTRVIMDSLGISSKGKKEISDKESFLLNLRAQLSSSAIEWLDAAFVLTGKGAKYPPLLGTGGNDGRLDFTNNFMQRLLDLFETDDGGSILDKAKAYLLQAFFEQPVSGLRKGCAIGQFYPGAAGGANSSTGYSSDSLINPWDFVLMIEGSMAFGAACVKRLSKVEPGALAYPFAVRQTGAGYPSASDADDSSRAEMWMPLWEQPATFREVRQLLSEGRGQVGRRSAKTGTDFARAVAGLGVDRGIQGFVRYGFQVRNGLAYFATPIGRWKVAYQPNVRLIDELDGWLESLRRVASEKKSPARIKQAMRLVDDAVFNYCSRGGKVQLQNVLSALGKAEISLNKSRRFCREQFISPIQPMQTAWLEQTDDKTAEYAIAAALASIQSASIGSIRCNVEAVVIRGDRVKWNDIENPPHVVWGGGDLCRNMIRIIARRCLDSIREGDSMHPIWGKRPLDLCHVAAFLNGEVDRNRVADIFLGLMLINWQKVEWTPPQASPIDMPLPDARYAILKLCFLPDRGKRLLDHELSRKNAIISKLRAGDLQSALTMAVRLVRGGGIMPRFHEAAGCSETAIRLAASLILPISPYAEGWLLNRVCYQKSQD